MARPIALQSDAARVSQIRTVTGSPVAADSSTLNDTNFPAGADPTNGGALNCRSYNTLWLNAEFTGGTSPTVTVAVLVRDTDAADGSRWKPLLVAPVVLDGTGFVEVPVYSRLIYPRISAVTGNPTAVRLLAFGGDPVGEGKRLPV